MDEHWRTGFSCPQCVEGEVVYSGNYYCSRLGIGCTWALPEDSKYFLRYYLGLMKHRQLDPDPEVVLAAIDRGEHKYI